MHAFAYYDSDSSSGYAPRHKSHHESDAAQSQAIHLAVWFIVPVIAFTVIRLLMGNRSRQRMGFWGHVFCVLIYGAVSVVVWSFVRGK